MKAGRVSHGPRQQRRFPADHLRRSRRASARERGWGQLSPATARRTRHAPRVALLLVFAAPEGGPDGAGVCRHAHPQALSRRQVLRPRERSFREDAARGRRVERRGRHRGCEAAGSTRAIQRRAPRRTRPRLRRGREGQTREGEEGEEKAEPMTTPFPTMKTFLPLLLCTLAASSLHAADAKPNIIFVMAVKSINQNSRTQKR